jgi:LysM repeat protein
METSDTVLAGDRPGGARRVLSWWKQLQGRRGRLLLGRLTAHLSMLLAAVLILTVGRVHPPSPALGGPSGEPFVPQPLPTAPSARAWAPTPMPPLARVALPHTIIPARPRAAVITYTVQPGDTLSSIAAQFGITIWTLIWSNREAVWDAPWLIQPGLTLYIPPVDGVYHTVAAGETVESIAAKYQVDPSALYNEWNDLKEGQPLTEGQQLMVVGGKDKYIDLNPPPPKPVVGRGRAEFRHLPGRLLHRSGRQRLVRLPHRQRARLRLVLPRPAQSGPHRAGPGLPPGRPHLRVR